MTAIILVCLLTIGTIVTLVIGAGMFFVGRILGHEEPKPPQPMDVATMSPHQVITARIEIADLRARIKRLEAIAAGDDL